jgi:hAT family protein
MLESRRQEKLKRSHAALDELDRYLNLPTEDKECSPLKFWKSQQSNFPAMARLARQYLSMPASSGSVERLFSVAGAIGRSRRARIQISTMEKALCVRQELLNRLKSSAAE